MSRKRSRNIALTLMAGSAVAACGEPDKPTEASLYKSVDDCLAADVYEDDVCRTQYADALTAHTESAPRYDARALCEEQYGVGQCEPRRSGSSSFWSPFFAGYLVSNLLDNRGGYGYYSSPYYRDRYGRNVTWNGGLINTTRGADGRIRHAVSQKKVTEAKKPARILKRTRSVSRRGFGGRSRGGRSWGG